MFVLANETEEKWQALLDECIERFRPSGALEREIVVEIAHSRWRLRRMWTVETGLIDLEMDQTDERLRQMFTGFDEGTRLACAFKSLADNSRALDVLARYEARTRRSFDRALANLRALQTERGEGHPGEIEKLPNKPDAGPAAPSTVN